MKEPAKSQYLIKEFAALTRTTVRALHHYDRIGLLRPSGRRPNGYRFYTQADLLRLEQVIALKFLGFSLREIRRILESPKLSLERSLRVQAGIIAEEVRRLERAARAVRQILEKLEAGKKLDSKKIVAVIKEIQMSEEQKKSWAERFFTPEELKEFSEIGKGYPPERMEAYQKGWTALIEEVRQNLGTDPAGPVGQDLARRWRALLDEAYGGHPDLKKRIGEAYRRGAIPAEYQMMSSEVWEYMSRACSALGKNRK
jgi:DNA-binding transcriptional MerR regulator